MNERDEAHGEFCHAKSQSCNMKLYFLCSFHLTHYNWTIAVIFDINFMNDSLGL